VSLFRVPLKGEEKPAEGQEQSHGEVGGADKPLDPALRPLEVLFSLDHADDVIEASTPRLSISATVARRKGKKAT